MLNHCGILANDNQYIDAMKTIRNITSISFTFFFLASIIVTGCTKNDEEIADIPDDNLPEITAYPIVGTNQTIFYNNSTTISAPNSGDSFHGQNAHYPGNQPSYVDNGDGTVTDMLTGLMWQQSPDTDGDGDIDANDKLTYEEALAEAAVFNLGGYDDWRLPSIKEQYSLILFSGVDPSGYEGSSTDGLIPFIDTDYFDFAYGDTDAGERIIDAQYASSNKYVDVTM